MLRSARSAEVQDESGIFRDIVHPISPEARQFIESQILDAYHNHLAQQAAAEEASETEE